MLARRSRRPAGARFWSKDGCRSWSFSSCPQSSAWCWDGDHNMRELDDSSTSSAVRLKPHFDIFNSFRQAYAPWVMGRTTRKKRWASSSHCLPLRVHEQWGKASHASFQGLAGKHEAAWWIILSCHAAMALGTMAGGWRIVKTIGSPNHPTSETRRRLLSRDGGGDYDRFGNACKVPILTTHAIGGAVSGVGASWLARSALDLGLEDRCGLGRHLPRCSIDRCRRICICSVRYSAIHPIVT
jgi:phosphate/sulfate permease